MAEKNVFGVEPKVKVTETAKTEIYQVIFTLVTRNKKTQICVSNKIVSTLVFDSIKAAKAYIDSKPWELIINATLVVDDLSKEDRKEMNNNNQ